MIIERATMIMLTRRKFMVGATAAGISALVAACGSSSPPASGASANRAAIKLVAVYRKRADFTDQQFYDYWMSRHGPYASQQIAKLGAFRYVQSHTDYSDLTTELRASRGQSGTAEQGISSVWFPSAQALTDQLNTPEGLLAYNNLAMDEANFLDLAKCSNFYTSELVMING